MQSTSFIMQKAEQDAIRLAGIKQRLAMYEEECRKKKEMSYKNTVVAPLEVHKLDDSMTDLTKFARSPTKTPKHKVDFIKKLSGSASQPFTLTLEADSDVSEKAQSPKAISATKPKWTKKSAEFTASSPSSPKSPPQTKEQEAKDTIVTLLDNEDGGATLNEKVSFQSVRTRYLAAVTRLRPEPMQLKKPAQETATAKATRQQKLRDNASKKERYESLTQSYARYQQLATDKPKHQTAADQQTDAAISRAQEAAADDWTGFAAQVVAHAQDDSDADEDDDDLFYWIAEAKRLKADQERRAKAKRQAALLAERDALLAAEDDDVIALARQMQEKAQKAKGLTTTGKKKKASTRAAAATREGGAASGNTTSSTTLADRKKAFEKAGSAAAASPPSSSRANGVRKGGNYQLRPGMRDDNDGISTHQDDEDDYVPTGRKGNYNLRPGMRRGDSYEEDDVDADDADDGDDDEYVSSGRQGNYNLRPGMRRGNSYEDDEVDANGAAGDAPPGREGNYHLRPGMRRGNSFDEKNDGAITDRPNRKGNYGLRPGMQRGDSFDKDEENDVDDDRPSGRRGNYNLRPSMRRGDSLGHEGEDDDHAGNDAKDNDDDGRPSGRKGNYNMRPGSRNFDGRKDDSNIVEKSSPNKQNAASLSRKGDYKLRPGMTRGNSFDDYDGDNAEGATGSDVKRKGNYNLRPGMQRGSSFGDNSDDSSDVSDEDAGGKPRQGDYTLRPGMVRGQSMGDDDVQERNNGDVKSKKSTRKGNYDLRPGMQRGSSFDDSSDSDSGEPDQSSDKSDKDRSSKENEGSTKQSGAGEEGLGVKLLLNYSDGSDIEGVSPRERRKTDFELPSKSWKPSEEVSESSEEPVTAKKERKPSKKSSNNDKKPTAARDDSESDWPDTPPSKSKQNLEDIVLVEEAPALEIPDDEEEKPEALNIDGTPWKNPLKAWKNKPRRVKEVGSLIRVHVPEKTDCWRKTRHNFVIDTAPYCWHKVTGDFEVEVKIKANMSNMYDKAGLMVRLDDENWVMSGMECFNDRMNHATCLTQEYTDWTLSQPPVNAEKAGVWFKIVRRGRKYESLYSIDHKEWVSTRQGVFTERPVLKVGIVCAAPMGDPYRANFHYYRVTQM